MLKAYKEIIHLNSETAMGSTAKILSVSNLSAVQSVSPLAVIWPRVHHSVEMGSVSWLGKLRPRFSNQEMNISTLMRGLG